MKRTKRIGSLFLAFCMVLTMLPTMAFAETGNVDSGTPLGVSGTITAFTELSAETVAQSVYTGTTKDELILPKELTASITESGGETATGSDASRETQTTVAVERWTADPTYDGDTAGDYLFTPTLDLPEGLTLAEGATLPTITVTVEEQPAAPQARGMVGPLRVGIITGTMSVGGTTVSDLTQDANGTGWTWDAASATLTLNSSYQGGFIDFECADTDTINLVCNGAVTVNKGDTYAIQSWGSLVIKGDGPLTISGGLRASKDIIILGTMGDISGGSSSGIDANGSISIYGAVGNITGVQAILANGDITISDGAVVGKIGAEGSGPSSSTYGIYSYNGSVTINGATGDISGKSYGICAKGGNVFINGATGAISSAYGSFSGDSAIRASVGVAINGTTGVISSKGDYGIYAESGAVLIAGKTGDITGTKASGIESVGGITIPPDAVVGKIAGAQNGIRAGGSVTIGGKTGDITGIAGSTFGGGIQTTGSVTITGETGAITSTHASIPAIGAGGDVTIVGSVGEIAVTASSGGSGFGIRANGVIHIINSVTVSSFNGAFNKAPATLPSPSYTAIWSDNSDGSGSSAGSAYVWNASHKYVEIKKDSGTSAPTVSGFRAERTDADKVSFFFTPSTTGKYGCQIEKKGTPAPTFLGMFLDITAIVEFGIDAKEDGVTASDILVVYLQIENAEGVKSQIYSLEVPAYTPPVDAAAPIITDQPIGAIYDKNAPAAALSVAASVTDGGTLSYQWYYNLSNNTTSGSMIGGATGSSYTPDVSSAGTVYYYCVVTNTNGSATGNKTATVTSNTAAITVNAPTGGAVTGTMYVGGTPSVDLATNRAGIGWAWNPATATLMLDSSYGGMPIKIDCGAADTVKLVYSGDVSVTSNGSSTVFCQGNLIVNGSGSLTLNNTGSDPMYSALDVQNALTIQSGTVNATSSGSGTVFASAIYAPHSITISGDANVTATAAGAQSNGMYSTQNIIISTTGTVTATGAGAGHYGLSSNIAINISGGTVVLSNSSTPANLYHGTLNHTGGTLNGNLPPVDPPPMATGGTFPSNGTYQAGQKLDFAIAFNMPVVVNTTGGTPLFLLTVGTETRYANYFSGSGTNELVFRYTVQPGDLDTDGITSAVLLDLNGGTVRSAGGVNAGPIVIPPSFPGILINGASVATYTISGTIKDGSTGSGLGGATAWLFMEGTGAPITSATTDASGAYAFQDIPAGSYYIEAQCGGYQNSTISGVVVTNSNVSGKNVTLTKSVAVPVSTITITGIVEPVGGASPVKTGATVPADANYALKGLVWVDDENKTEPMADGAKFEAGKRYLSGVSVQLPFGYSFAPDVTATINGKTATVVLDGTKEAVVSYLFTAKDAADTPTITVTKHPQNVTVTQGRINATLTAEAVSSNGKPVSYQWYRFIGGIGPDNVEIIPGATSNTFSIPTNLTEGIYQYLCIFKADSINYPVDSNIAVVTVNPPSGSGDNGGWGGNGGGSIPPATAPTTPQTKPNQPTAGTVPVTATAGTNGTASATVSDKAITDAIAKAQADAKAQGNASNGISVELNVTMPQGATSLSATLSQNALQSLVSAGVTSLTINGSPVKVTFDLKALQEIQKQSNGTINISIAPQANLSAMARAMIGTRPVYNITVGYGSGRTVSGFGGGTATVSVPYTPAKGEAVGALYAVYVDEKGNATRIAGSAYDANSRSIIFTTTHFSLYGVGYTTPSAKFTDITSHWAKESIDYVVGRGLLSGTAETAFAPNTAMTRGMLVTALGRLVGVDEKVYTKSSFTDVKTDSPFRPYIEWAYSKGIVQGIGNQQFAPDRAITREEIAVIFANYAKATGYKLPVTHTAAAFVDASSIGSAYKDSVTAMQQAGIMVGETNNKFNPKSNATRAEVSSMLHRYIKLTINPATAQGWALNDDGQYLYYKDGKALTGTQTIDGMKYFFNTDGTLKIGWVKDSDNWRYYSGNKAAVGWLDISDKRYYFTKEGLMVSGKWLEIEGKWYYFNADGSLAKSTKIGEYEVDDNGVRKSK